MAVSRLLLCEKSRLVGCATLLMVAVLPAMAAPDDILRPYASLSAVHESNLFRLTDDDEAQRVLGTRDRREDWRRLEAGLSAAVPVSLQVFDGRLSVGRTMYSRFPTLNYSDYHGNLGWKWRVGDLLLGTLGYSDGRTLSSFSQSQVNIRNLHRDRKADFDLTYLISPVLRARAGLNRLGISNSDVSQQGLDTVQYTWAAGVDYVSRANNIVGSQLRVLDGHYPSRALVAGNSVNYDFRQMDAGFSSKWALTIDTVLDGSVGYTRRANSELAVRDFEGPTGRLNAKWRVTEATSLAASGWRTIGSYEDQTSSYVVNQGASGTATWAPLIALTLQGELKQERLRFDGDPHFSAQPSTTRSDRVRSASFKAAFRPLPQVELALTLQTEHRASNVYLRSYRADSIMATVRAEY